MLDMFSDSFLKRQDLFSSGYVHQLTEQHFEHRKDNRKLLWTLLMFQLWYQAYIEQG
jgi:asparagine synthase (glutamine-hydrolysing)